MDNEALSLQNFSSVFEIFAGYYLLLGVNRHFNDYFNIAGPFRAGSSNYNEIEHLRGAIADMETDITEHLRQTQPGSRTIEERRRDMMEENRILNEHELSLKPGKDCLKVADRLKRLIEMHFGQSDENGISTTEFFTFIRSYYIFFGCLSMSILILGGFYQEWNRIHVLNVINCISFAIACCLLYLVIRNAFWSVKLPQAKAVPVFVGTIPLFIALLLIPCRWYDKYMILPYVLSDESISFSDFQVISAVGIVLLPIIIHITALSIVVFTQYRFEKLKRLIPGELLPVNNTVVSVDIPDL